MINVDINRKDHTLKLKVDTLLTVHDLKELIRVLKDALKIVEGKE